MCSMVANRGCQNGKAKAGDEKTKSYQIAESKTLTYGNGLMNCSPRIKSSLLGSEVTGHDMNERCNRAAVAATNIVRNRALGITVQ